MERKKKEGKKERRKEGKKERRKENGGEESWLKATVGSSLNVFQRKKRKERKKGERKGKEREKKGERRRRRGIVVAWVVECCGVKWKQRTANAKGESRTVVKT